MRIRWRGLELPTRVLRDDVAGTERYGCFTVEPFERGFGTTVGNSLRRILLSSLEGAEVTSVRIKGAEHEFSSLPGVVEDVALIILNVKSLIIRMTGDAPKSMKVSVKGEKGKSTPVTAGQIESDASITILNPDQVLATLTEGVQFEMEMSVDRGRSYATAEDNKEESEDPIIGVIPIDSVFSPVRRVRYRVEDTRVGQRTNYDRLVMEVWTNGTVTPQMALVEAAKILRKHLNPFVQYSEMGSGLAAAGGGEFTIHGGDGGPVDEAKLVMPVESLELSARAFNCLENSNIKTVGDLVRMSEDQLLDLRSFGKTSLREVKRKLADLGLSLGMNLSGGGAVGVPLDEPAGAVLGGRPVDLATSSFGDSAEGRANPSFEGVASGVNRLGAVSTEGFVHTPVRQGTADRSDGGE